MVRVNSWPWGRGIQHLVPCEHLEEQETVNFVCADENVYLASTVDHCISTHLKYSIPLRLKL